MMTRRALFSAVVLVSAALGFANPASADEPPRPQDLDGTYTYSDGISTQQWVATPCGPDCINVDASAAAGKPGFSGQATNFRGWTRTVEGLPDVVKCDDGSTAAGGMNFRWDAQLTGYGHTFSTAEACGNPAQAYDRFNFTLTKV
jgi:hypothetical protein